MKQSVRISVIAGLMLGAFIIHPEMVEAQKKTTAKPGHVSKKAGEKGFKVEAEAFADLQLLRYQVPGFTDLPLQQKKLAYYLYEAALSGRDIIYDQKSKYGLLERKTLEAMYTGYTGPHNTKE